MPDPIRLSELVEDVKNTLSLRYESESYWIISEITDVKKQTSKKWCFLKFIEKNNNIISTEIKGVFWSFSYEAIEKFEKITGQVFTDGLEITCNVRIKFHQRFGLSLEVLDIDVAHTLGKLEMERRITLERLLKDSSDIIRKYNEEYVTLNNKLILPDVIQNVALVTAPDSDGQRDFNTELLNNVYGYKFNVCQYLTRIQGDMAAELIISQLKEIDKHKDKFDAVVITRGGGSQTDFQCFDDYDLAKLIAGFSVPVLTGIGHDRNTSIVDMMARQFKTPTKVAVFLIEHNRNFECLIEDCHERILKSVNYTFDKVSFKLKEIDRTVKNLSPEKIINKGFAYLMMDNKIITDPDLVLQNSEITTVLKNKNIISIVKDKYEKEPKGSDI